MGMCPQQYDTIRNAISACVQDTVSCSEQLQFPRCVCWLRSIHYTSALWCNFSKRFININFLGLLFHTVICLLIWNKFVLDVICFYYSHIIDNVRNERLIISSIQCVKYSIRLLRWFMLFTWWLTWLWYSLTNDRLCNNSNCWRSDTFTLHMVEIRTVSVSAPGLVWWITSACTASCSSHVDSFLKLPVCIFASAPVVSSVLCASFKFVVVQSTMLFVLMLFTTATDVFELLECRFDMGGVVDWFVLILLRH